LFVGPRVVGAGGPWVSAVGWTGVRLGVGFGVALDVDVRVALGVGTTRVGVTSGVELTPAARTPAARLAGTGVADRSGVTPRA
jgi:hypothetical protein